MEYQYPNYIRSDSPNLVTNGSFEQDVAPSVNDVTGWNQSGPHLVTGLTGLSLVVAPVNPVTDGDQSLFVQTYNTNAGAFCVIPETFVEGLTYHAEIDVWSAYNGDPLQVILGGADDYATVSFDSSSTYQTVAVDWTPTEDRSGDYGLIFRTVATGGAENSTICLDRASVHLLSPIYPNSLAEEMYDELAPLVQTFGDVDEHLRIYVYGLCRMLQMVDDISKDGPDGEPGWSQIFDLTRAKTEWLPWAGQLVGYQVPSRPADQTEAEYSSIQRERIVTRSSWRRATVEILKDTALDHLVPGTPRSHVIVQERVGNDPWLIKVWVFDDDIATSAALIENAVRKQKLAELLMEFDVLTGAENYALLNASNATYAIMKPKFTNYADVRTDPGR
jgi:hypothetical protein